MPQPSTMAHPVTFCHSLAVPSEAAIPPACETHREEKSSALNSGFCSSALNKVLTAGIKWKGRRFRTATNLGISRGLGISVNCEPQRIDKKHRVSAKIWYRGKAAMLLDLETSPMRFKAGENQASACRTAAITLRCVSTAPLDKPVVPPVYCKKATESKFVVAGCKRIPWPALRACCKVVMVRLRPFAEDSGKA